MPAMTVSRRKVTVVVKFSQSVPKFLVEARSVVDAMTGNKWFPTPNPPLATISSKIDALVDAQSFAATRAASAVAKRDALHATLLDALHLLRAYVQTIADANPEDAPGLVQSAGMHSKSPTSYRKPPFEVKLGAVHGMVELIVRAAAKRAVYFWQYSLDKETWVDLPETMTSKTTATGLKSATVHYFRYSVRTPKGRTEWSDPVEFLVK
jgi:hypothetical protein